ncbi:hypothetical protein KR084_000355 [Drosophila pseudotakahashii]|nr:hypothetical protein KR084_000355 [Drosophila pseudotakahashii]
MSRRRFPRRSSACRNDDQPQDSQKRRRTNCQDYRFQHTETYPSIRPGEPRCDPNQDEAMAGLANSLAADGCGRPFDMVKDDVLLAWQQSPHKDTLGFYGVGSPTHQPESVVFNQVLAACLVKVSGGGTRRRRPKKTRTPPPRTIPAGHIFEPQLCKSFILNRQALQSELRQMPHLKRQLEPQRAFETVYCPDPTDPSDPFRVSRQEVKAISRDQALDMGIRPKNIPPGVRRRHWYCPMDCGEVRNKCTQYEWARYKLDPRPHNREFRDWLQEQRELRYPEPKDYDQLYERFLKCFEQKPSPDPLCKIFQECCQPKTPLEKDNQGGGDGHGCNGGDHQGGGPGGPPSDQGKPSGEKGTGEKAGGTGDSKDTGDGREKNIIEEKEKNRKVEIKEEKGKDDDEKTNKDEGKSKNKNKKNNNNKNKDKVNEDESENYKDEKKKEETDIKKEESNIRKEESDIKKEESDIKKEESDIKKKDTPKRKTSKERFSEKGRPSVIPVIPLEKGNERPSNRETSVTHSITEFPEEYDQFEPIFPNATLKVPHKKKKKVRNKTVGKDRIKKICKPCPPPDCQCEICHFRDRHYNEPEAPFMRDMRRAEQRRQQRAYYRQMCHREYLRSQCREEYRAPRHNCDPICCDNFLCRNPRLAEHCDCLGAVQELQKLLSGAKDKQDCGRLLHRVENLRRRLCQRMCDCVMA